MCALNKIGCYATDEWKQRRKKHTLTHNTECGTEILRNGKVFCCILSVVWFSFTDSAKTKSYGFHNNNNPFHRTHTTLAHPNNLFAADNLYHSFRVGDRRARGRNGTLTIVNVPSVHRAPIHSHSANTFVR